MVASLTCLPRPGPADCLGRGTETVPGLMRMLVDAQFCPVLPTLPPPLFSVAALG